MIYSSASIKGIMHRQTILKLCEAARMEYCDTDCPCGENNRLIWDTWSVTKMPDWVPNWANGADPEELYEWMLEQSDPDIQLREALQYIKDNKLKEETNN